jgi:hypothetical protein
VVAAKAKFGQSFMELHLERNMISPVFGETRGLNISLKLAKIT